MPLEKIHNIQLSRQNSQNWLNLKAQQYFSYMWNIFHALHLRKKCIVWSPFWSKSIHPDISTLPLKPIVTVLWLILQVRFDTVQNYATIASNQWKYTFPCAMHWCHHLQYQYNCMKFLNKSKTKWYFNDIFRDLWQLFLISLVNVFKGNNTNKIQKPLPKTLVKVQKPIYPIKHVFKWI